MSQRLVISFFVLFYLFGQTATLEAQEEQELDSISTDWNFRISPYFWFIGLKGTIIECLSRLNYQNPHLQNMTLM